MKDLREIKVGRLFEGSVDWRDVYPGAIIAIKYKQRKIWTTARVIKSPLEEGKGPWQIELIDAPHVVIIDLEYWNNRRDNLEKIVLLENGDTIPLIPDND